MEHQIENEFLKISVNQTGAELSRIESVKTGQSFLWDGDPAFWPNHSPVLFPIVGGLKDNSYFYNGKSYSLPRHGFIRGNKKIQLTNQTENSLTFGLVTDDESFLVYPFQFEFSITYTLFANRVVVSHLIKNHGQGDMFFSVGAHPAFGCPLHEGETYEDYYLEFEKPETDSTWVLSAEGLVTEESKPTLHNTNVLHLSRTLFDHDALIFKNLKSCQVSLRSTKSQQVLTVQYEDFPYLGLWAKPNAPFICIEPWLGIADSTDTNQDLATKEGIIGLKSKHHFSAAYSIEINE
jgi:galactose mutarotase-like enzyme